MRRRIAEISGHTLDGVGDRHAGSHPVGHGVGDDQGDCGAAVEQWQRCQPPGRSPLGIDRQRGLLVGPDHHLVAPDGMVSDVDFRRTGPVDPVMAPERQRRSLDATSQQSAPQIAAEAVQSVEINCAPVYPGELDHRVTTECAQAQQRCLIDVGQGAVHTAMVDPAGQTEPDKQCYCCGFASSRLASSRLAASRLAGSSLASMPDSLRC